MISHEFGTPKPTLANSYEPELLHLRTFPTLMGYSSRIMAESWESNTLYWVALADELSLSPADLNVRIPQWTRKLVEEIFASHLEDWPAVLRSLRQVGEEVRSQNRTLRWQIRKPNLREFPIGKTTMTISRRELFGLTAGGLLLRGQDQKRPIFRVKVDMVVLSYQVTDSKNHYIKGLKPGDFRIFEDGILQRISTFAEGSNTPVAVSADGTTRPLLEAHQEALPGIEKPDAFVGTNVFVLFDTSNFMYKGFVYAEDAITDFVRGLDGADSVAVYTFSRNLSRAASLTREKSEAIAGLRKAVAGDDTRSIQRAAADIARRRQGAGPQGGDRFLQRSRQRQHGGARRCARGGGRRGHSDLRDLHRRSE